MGAGTGRGHVVQQETEAELAGREEVRQCRQCLQEILLRRQRLREREQEKEQNDIRWGVGVQS